MPAFKPDSSFFRKIVLGVIGSRAVAADLNSHGHQIFELERGSTDTKLWKDVKRKRVRLPDLICTKCGLRVESRAKSKPELSMSHSPTERERSWDFGMVDADVVAFPVCQAVDEKYWSTGKLNAAVSYWHERDWVRWVAHRHVNYFSVERFRRVPFITLARKGVTEASELTIGWPATFATYEGAIESVSPEKVTIRRATDGRNFARRIKQGQVAVVEQGHPIASNQVIASSVFPIPNADLRCPARLPDGHIARLLESRERTQRFAGIKLARLRREGEFCPAVAGLVRDAEEDIYVRLEGVAYEASVCRQPLEELIGPHLENPDPQVRLEVVITLSEAQTPTAVEILGRILDNPDLPYFLRSAAAWGLGRIGGDAAPARLIGAFSDVTTDIRQEALDAIVQIGGSAVPILVSRLRGQANDAIAAGCAEALRQRGAQADVPVDEIMHLLTEDPSHWTTWLVGMLPRERVAASVAPLQESHPELHYAINVLWSFIESWVARRWELRSGAEFPQE
jgi:hypothetical protein